MMRDALAATHGGGRLATGLVCLVVPHVVERLWFGRSRPGPGTVLMRAVGARDVAIGAGLLSARRDAERARPWLLAGALCDAIDVLATFASRRHVPRRSVVGLTAAAAPSLAWQVALARPRPPAPGGRGA